MDVSVIIVNYKTSRLIIDCVKSIIELTEGLNYEVIIVDNNSEPQFEEIISTKIPASYQKKFRFLSLPENIGFGRANNEGLKISSGRNILFLNPDTIILNNAIKILSDFLDSHPKAGACGGNLYNENLKPTYSYKRLLPGILWEINELINIIPEKIIYGGNRFFNHTENNFEVGFICGADLMVKREVIEKTGAFSKEIFLYFEEPDLCYRLKRKGWKTYSVPKAKIQHLESKSFDKTQNYQSEVKIKHIEKSRILFYKLNKKRFSRGISLLIYRFSLETRIILIKDKLKKNYYKQRKKYFLSK